MFSLSEAMINKSMYIKINIQNKKRTEIHTMVAIM